MLCFFILWIWYNFRQKIKKYITLKVSKGLILESSSDWKLGFRWKKSAEDSGPCKNWVGLTSKKLKYCNFWALTELHYSELTAPFLSHCLSAPHQKGPSAEEKTITNTSHTPIWSSSFLCPASGQDIAHLLINFPFWFQSWQKLKTYSKEFFPLFCDMLHLHIGMWSNIKPKFLTNQSAAKQTKEKCFNCFKTHRALGFKVSIKPKPLQAD